MGVSYSEIIERMRWAGKLKNDSAVARVLSVTPQALSNYKKRGEMPTDLVLRFSGIYGLSVDWLITGEGDMYRPGGHAAGAETEGLLIAAEETAAYGKDREGPKRRLDFGNLSPDEIIYVGKLLKILRGPNKSTSEAIRYTVDAFLKNSGKKPEQEEEKESKN